ncbi:GNAT family N-acetyltransferase [Ferrovum sp. PN-J185]|uniref:GNAT family N-acetyltransferase n=1 Tax=Ferrovum sp. PN-J185 TaxID=1356306 RepID=UPI0007981177|nr:GNAT family N-acetyltransferase [Ferrovum sp. PN-J185]KXW56703.1 aminoalkylphosphonic acid N-acetyltransferase [Ferrovum sp. PN-J185]MCC6067612.1 GNAT family N-acetyltransferase [Ferrovum sp. PN-J185]MDE1892028.1 GNAT family N-acetyltransferase [Betaproteobacteria bacterium]MDE2056523.1 GNAT family N-acetyltransferase [Betaproteobacteria bacterium]
MDMIAITGADRSIIREDLLTLAESLHRTLRPNIPSPYSESMREVFQTGAEMAVAMEDNVLCGLVVFRITTNTMVGRKIYSEDLVADPKAPVKGVGHLMMDYLKEVGRQRGCVSIELESGTQREQAHRFYFKEGFVIKAFGFKQSLKD